VRLTPLAVEASGSLPYIKHLFCAIHAIASHVTHLGDEPDRFQPVDGSLGCGICHTKPLREPPYGPEGILREDVQCSLRESRLHPGKIPFPAHAQFVDTLHPFHGVRALESDASGGSNAATLPIRLSG